MHKKIKDMEARFRPREKMMKRGRKAMTDVELMAIILRTGIPGKNIKVLSQEILNRIEEKDISEVEYDAFTGQVKGIAEAKALQLVASLELSTRFLERKKKAPREINDLKQALLLLDDIRSHKREHVTVLFLDGRRNLIEKKTIHIGTSDRSFFCVQDIIEEAFEHRAAGIIVAHNHPSGDCTPSPEDKAMMAKLSRMAYSMDINLLDFLILSADDHFSFFDQISSGDSELDDAYGQGGVMEYVKKGGLNGSTKSLGNFMQNIFQDEEKSILSYVSSSL